MQKEEEASMTASGGSEQRSAETMWSGVPTDTETMTSEHVCSQAVGVVEECE